MIKEATGTSLPLEDYHEDLSPEELARQRMEGRGLAPEQNDWDIMKSWLAHYAGLSARRAELDAARDKLTERLTSLADAIRKLFTEGDFPDPIKTDGVIVRTAKGRRSTRWASGDEFAEALCCSTAICDEDTRRALEKLLLTEKTEWVLNRKLASSLADQGTLPSDVVARCRIITEGEDRVVVELEKD